MGTPKTFSGTHEIMRQMDSTFSPEPVIDKTIIERAVEGMDAVRVGEYENRHTSASVGLESR